MANVSPEARLILSAKWKYLSIFSELFYSEGSDMTQLKILDPCFQCIRCLGKEKHNQVLTELQ